MKEDLQKRKQILQEIRGEENRRRMQNSQTEWDIYTGNIRPYVEQRLIRRFNAKFVCKLPLVSSVNVLKRLIKKKASIYKEKPDREFIGLSEEQAKFAQRIYKDARANFVMSEANALYELQCNQTHILVEPKNGRIVFRPMKSHQINVVPYEDDPETAEFFIISNFNSNDNQNKTNSSDYINQKIADLNDSALAKERHIVWGREDHYVMNGKGEIISEDTRNPIAPLLPIVEVSAMKDFKYWREETNDVADFTIEHNVSLTMESHIVERQGFSQAYMKGPESLLPETVETGPTSIIRIVTDPNQPSSDSEFGFATPGSNISGTIEHNEKKLSQFLSSQGIESNSITGQSSGNSYTSGQDRFLAQLENFQAAGEAMEIFKDAEMAIWEIIKAWHSKTKLDKKYGTTIPMTAEMEIKFSPPTAVLSETEKLDYAERMQDLGQWDRYDVYAYLNSTTRDKAMEILGNEPATEDDQTDEDGSESEIQS